MWDAYRKRNDTQKAWTTFLLMIRKSKKRENSVRKIDLKKEFQLKAQNIRPLSRDQYDAANEYISKIVEKGFISREVVEYTLPLVLVQKKITQ
jgi:hypothetical protein